MQAHPIEQRCEFQSTRKFVYSVGAKWEIRVGSHKDAQCMRCTCLPVITLLPWCVLEKYVSEYFLQGAAVSCVPSEKVCPRIDECLQYEDVPNSCCPKCIGESESLIRKSHNKPGASAWSGTLNFRLLEKRTDGKWGINKTFIAV